jgi:hypothetical protein
VSTSADYLDGKDFDNWEEIGRRWSIIRQKHSALYQPGYCIGDNVGMGWWGLLEATFTKIGQVMAPHPECFFAVRQLKEKFGTLRFYYVIGLKEGYQADDDACEAVLQYLDTTVDAIITKAEMDSSAACETCGKPGELRRDGWLKTRCDEHADR